MQKLREFRHRHELEWGWQAEELMSKSRRERGELIHNQRSNAVADIAAVLAGAGRGNRMWAAEPLPVDAEAAEATTAAASEEAESQPAGAAAPENIDETTARKSKSKSKAKANAVTVTAPKTLVKANIYWSNDADQHWASEWTDNVTHSVGLPEHITNPRFKTSYLLDEEGWEELESENASDAQGTAAEPATGAEQDGKTAQEEKPQQKKGWLGWMGGKSGSSSQETRV